jgi:hypothetical protein
MTWHEQMMTHHQRVQSFSTSVNVKSKARTSPLGLLSTVCPLYVLNNGECEFSYTYRMLTPYYIQSFNEQEDSIHECNASKILP